MWSVGDELERIYETRGRLDPEDVVHEATPEDHPLHGRFTWDDAIAGPLYRIEEARRLIRSVKLTIQVLEHGKVTTARVRAFPNIATEAGETYIPLAIVQQDPAMQHALMAQMRAEIGQLKQKFEAHAELFRSVLREESAA